MNEKNAFSLGQSPMQVPNKCYSPGTNDHITNLNFESTQKNDVFSDCKKQMEKIITNESVI